MREPDAGTLAALLIAAVIFYEAPWGPVYLVALLIVAALSWRRPDLALVLPLVFSPLFMLPKHIGHQEFAQSFLQTIPDWMEVSSRLDRIQDEVRSELLRAEHTVFLFSSENFTLVSPERVKAYFEQVFTDVCFRIIFFARSQDELAESQYNQDVKWSGLAVDFDDFIATAALEEVEFDVLLTPWAEHFGPDSIIARIYDAFRRSLCCRTSFPVFRLVLRGC